MNRDGTLFFTRGGRVSYLRACLGVRLLSQSYQYPNLSESVECVGGQLRGDKECPFSGVTKSGRVWRKVPESGARSVHAALQNACLRCFVVSYLAGTTDMKLLPFRRTLICFYSHHTTLHQFTALFEATYEGYTMRGVV